MYTAIQSKLVNLIRMETCKLVELIKIDEKTANIRPRGPHFQEKDGIFRSLIPNR